MVDVDENITDEKNTQSKPQAKSQLKFSNSDQKKDVVEKKKSIITKEEMLEKDKLSKATRKVASQESGKRLDRVDNYVQKVEQGVVKETIEGQKKMDIEMVEDKEKKLRRLEEAIKSNLTGYTLEKEL